jgi:DNA primase
MSALSEDLHDSARVVSTLRTLQSQLPAKSLDIGARSEELGTIDSPRQRAGPNAGPIHRAPVGRPAILLLAFADDSVVAGRWAEHLRPIHHPCLGLERHPLYSARGGEQFMNQNAIDELKQRIPLLEYAQAHGWKVARSVRGGRFLGLCPLHDDHNPSFLVGPCRNLFYCYGCARGGDVIRFTELYHKVKFPQAVALLHQWCGVTPLLEQVTNFYRMQLARHREAVCYLQQRGLQTFEVIDHMRIGYAPGRCLRAWLGQLGYAPPALQQAGLVSANGYDTYAHRIVFPLECNLYGRSIGDAAPHRFLPGSKGGLYAWGQVRQCHEIILVEGLFDYAVLWQAGFHNVTCLLGNHPNATQLQQLCDGPRHVYIAFDSDANQSGQRAAQCVARSLRAQGVSASQILLPDGHDPNSFFVQGGNAQQFQLLLEAARP